MKPAEFSVVTGAFSFTGRLIAERLLRAGVRVRTLTNHPVRDHPLFDRVEIAPLNLADVHALTESLRGATVLYNTYWIRFPRGPLTFEQAVVNSTRLFTAAKEAGVERVVHVSIANPSLTSPLPYYRGKARVEEALNSTGLSRAILRPTMLFGDRGILLNNLAWILRRLPVFLVPGDGNYRVQPIAAEDLADLAVAAGASRENTVQDAAGPEIFGFEELLRIIAALVGSPVRFLHVPPAQGLWATRLLGRVMGDVLVTPDELRGLMGNLLVSSGRPLGERPLSEWLGAHRFDLGRQYLSELALHYRK